MRINTRALLSATAIVLVLSIPPAAWGQHKHGAQKRVATPGMKMDMPMMTMMMNSPHHKLMTAYLTSMSAFATSLREQSMQAEGMDAEVARGTVAELRHDFDAMEALHQKHMQSMSAEMQAKMKVMMDEMEKKCAEMKEQVILLEADMQADKPDSAQVTAHADALLKRFEMMAKMHHESKAVTKHAGMKM